MIKRADINCKTFESEMQPSLLLHACCAPCSTSVYKILADNYALSVYWYNPNIYPKNEHDKRLIELIKLSKAYDFELIIDPNSAIDQSKWLQFSVPDQQFSNLAIQQLSAEPEGGLRCHHCYRFRLKKVLEYAVKNKFDYFSTTLTVSPHKNAPKILEIGRELALGGPVAFLDQDFKKKDGYKKSIEISKELGLYRQDYCGCKYSLRKS